MYKNVQNGRSPRTFKNNELISVNDIYSICYMLLFAFQGTELLFVLFYN